MSKIAEVLLGDICHLCTSILFCFLLVYFDSLYYFSWKQSVSSLKQFRLLDSGLYHRADILSLRKSQKPSVQEKGLGLSPSDILFILENLNIGMSG